jgi:hypothetical protein
MADENRELQDGMEELRNAVQGLNASTKDATVGLQAFGKKAKELPADITKGMAGFAKQVASGDTSLKSMNAVVDIAANAVGGLAKTIPFVGEALSALAKGVAEGAKLIVSKIDETAKAYDQVAASGAAVADGMTGLFRQFNTAGLSLQQFQKVVTQNAQALARFKGMAGAGAEDFSEAVGKLTQGQDTSLRKLGMGAGDIADTAAAFVTQQTRLGKSQSMTTEQISAGTKQYALELDALSKVTGLSREAIQKQQDAALSESKFRANYELMMANGQGAAAKAMMTLQTRMSSFGAEMGQGVRDLSSGVANTDAAQKLVNSTGGAALDIMARVKSGAIDQDQAQNEIIAAMEKHKQAQLQIASQTGSTTGVYLETAQVMDAINAKNAGSYEKAKTVQNDQINKTDDLTKSTVKAQQNIEGMNIEMNNMFKLVLPTAARATEELSGAMKKMVKWINTELGRPEQTDEALDAQDKANRAQMKWYEKANQSIEKAVEAGVGLVWKGGEKYLKETRVGIETEYLKKEGRAGVVSPAGKSTGGSSSGGTSSAPAASEGAAPTSSSSSSGAKDHPSGPTSAGNVPGPNEQGVKPSVLAKKAALEAILGRPLTVTSGFRAGAANHGSGDAIDLGLGSNKLSEGERNKLLKAAVSP